MEQPYKKTYFIDVDGTLLKKQPFEKIITEDAEILPGVKEYFDKLKEEQAVVIITTARPEELREFTADQLHDVGLWFDHLLMGIGRSERILINDTCYHKPVAATAINLKKDQGFLDLL
jgi:histidinol phosphatase-like enzyme